jgi:hypothetical protein
VLMFRTARSSSRKPGSEGPITGRVFSYASESAGPGLEFPKLELIMASI